MMNLLALGLVLTSLLTAGFFTPNPQPKSAENVIVKEGHRVVVVEYDKDDGNTKVLISPPDSHQTNSQAVDEKGFLANAGDKLSEKMENLKEVASSVLGEAGEVGNHVFRPRELVCDAYGKCKHKIASAFGKSEAVVEKAAEKVKETVSQTAQKASHKVEEAKENLKDSASEASSKAARKMEGAKETAAEKGGAAVESARRVRKEGQKELKEILWHAREVARDIVNYVAPRERVAPVARVLHLMGFAAAYGMSVWMTFASSYVLAAALPRQQFAVVQSKMYPVYFKAMGCCVGMALLGHLIGPSRRLPPARVSAFQGLNLVAALAMILANLWWLEPRATKVMLERMKKEKEEGAEKEGHPATTTEPNARIVDSTVGAGRGATAEEAVARAQIIELSQTLQRLNSYSSFLNVLTLVSLTWHLVHLSQRMHTTC